MVFFNYATMQMAAKIVYYGPGLCGKTTNLHHIYSKTSPGSRGEMVSLETETDRTLFFDLLPIDVGVIGGFKTRLQLYTVPGQVFYNTTRKLVLKGVDGIVFVADSQKAMLEANVESFKNLRENLAEIGTNLDEIPLVIQLNKRDLPNIADPDTIMNALDPERRAEAVEAVAFNGVGVFETLKVISKLTLRTLRRRMTGDEPAKAAPAAGRATFRVQDHTRTMAGTTPVPVAEVESTSTALVDEIASEIPETVAPVAEPSTAEGGRPYTEAEIDRNIIADAPVAEAPVPEPEPEPEPQAEAQPEAQAEPVAAAPAPLTLDDVISAAGPAPEIEFKTAEKPIPVEPEVKTVKVRSSVDVMAELEALRKRATNTTTKAPKRDILADLASLRPKRDINRTLHLSIPADLLPKAKSVRVTLSFEDGEQGVIDTRDQQVELGDTSDVQSLSVNVKIELA
jgi:signal recognition particle receptor subunit beta